MVFGRFIIVVMSRGGVWRMSSPTNYYCYLWIIFYSFVFHAQHKPVIFYFTIPACAHSITENRCTILPTLHCDGTASTVLKFYRPNRRRRACPRVVAVTKNDNFIYNDRNAFSSKGTLRRTTVMSVGTNEIVLETNDFDVE